MSRILTETIHRPDNGTWKKCTKGNAVICCEKCRGPFVIGPATGFIISADGTVSPSFICSRRREGDNEDCGWHVSFVLSGWK